MGAVYRAHQLSLDRKVALKVLPPRYARSPEMVARFTREALSAAQLTHHNIIQVYDVGNERG
jgi:eukaryotic-like serine/threonine-protein kinase